MTTLARPRVLQRVGGPSGITTMLAAALPLLIALCETLAPAHRLNRLALAGTGIGPVGTAVPLRPQSRGSTV